ncbi:hypothetical protein ND00_26580 [Clostridium sp. L74]|nr:hypothetical protein ND00_26580 [Clostridium sp. L74]
MGAVCSNAYGFNLLFLHKTDELQYNVVKDILGRGANE